MAVVKANAYGHGLARVLTGLDEADSLALLEMESARWLRNAGWAKGIMLLEGCFDLADLQESLALQLDFVVHNKEQLGTLEHQVDALAASAFKPRIYLKINTGMNRLGFTPEQAPDVIRRLETLVAQCKLPVPVLTTHFANADADNLANKVVTPEDQYACLQALKPAHWQCSLGNSAGALNWPKFVGDYFRPGISIYGATPGPNSAAHYGLKPAMAFTSEVISVQSLKAGQAVGYGSRYVATGNQQIAVVACGYADGYPRHAPDGTPVWIKGARRSLVGRVSMDMLTVDVTGLDLAAGESVELWGAHLPVDEVAKPCGTIGYELLCAITQRVPFQIGAIHGQG